ncbi:MAG TPA: DUF2029 domain-containing protein [Firmicutes bacterium]|nr:DUF2029 domain-containing protein [Bacillota bacterium]
MQPAYIWAIIALIQFFLMLAVAWDVFQDKDPYESCGCGCGLLIAITVIPIIGPVLYFIFRRRIRDTFWHRKS